MNNFKYSAKVVMDLKQETYIEEDDLNSIKRLLKQSEVRNSLSDNNSITMRRFIEMSLDYLCSEYMTICRNNDDMADIMALKRHLDTIKDGLKIDESIVDRFTSLYL
ncbi:MAG: hypothetical protein ACR2NW_06550 [Thermodesulfobacteriota bacterium]